MGWKNLGEANRSVGHNFGMEDRGAITCLEIAIDAFQAGGINDHASIADCGSEDALGIKSQRIG